MDETKKSSNKLPSYLQIYKDITDEEDYMPFTFARKDYRMSAEDKQKTAVVEQSAVND